MSCEAHRRALSTLSTMMEVLAKADDRTFSRYVNNLRDLQKRVAEMRASIRDGTEDALLVDSLSLVLQRFQQVRKSPRSSPPVSPATSRESRDMGARGAEATIDSVTTWNKCGMAKTWPHADCGQFPLSDDRDGRSTWQRLDNAWRDVEAERRDRRRHQGLKEQKQKDMASLYETAPWRAIYLAQKAH